MTQIRDNLPATRRRSLPALLALLLGLVLGLAGTAEAEDLFDLFDRTWHHNSWTSSASTNKPIVTNPGAPYGGIYTMPDWEFRLTSVEQNGLEGYGELENLNTNDIYYGWIDITWGITEWTPEITDQECLVFFGTDGNDLLRPVEFQTIMFFALGGDDTIEIQGTSPASQVLAFAGDGDDTIDMASGTGTCFLYGDWLGALASTYVPTGNDTILGSTVNDYIEGGDNLSSGSQWGDMLYAGDGDDEVWGDVSDGSASGTDGDYIEGNAGHDLLNGQENDDRIEGGDGDDAISGGTGDDVIFGDDGDDILVGWSGNDWIEGGAGRDDLYGDQSGASSGSVTPGEDHLYGGDGDDLLFGGGETDYLYGEDGDDALDGGTGADFLYGDFDNTSLGSGMDFLFDDDNNADELHGGGGNDLLWSNRGTGNDSLYGNGGSGDTFWAQGGDTVDGSTEVDGSQLGAPHASGPHGYIDFLFGASQSDNFVHRLTGTPATNSFWTNAYAGTRSA